MQPISIVLLGGIASGKSRVASLFEDQGAKVLVGDAIAHDLLEEEEVQQLIAETFGQQFLTEAGVDKKKLASEVFTRKEQLKKLEAILHPRVFVRLTEATQKLAQDEQHQIVLYDVPLAAETGLAEGADVIVYVDTDESIRIDRAIKTRGWTAEELQRREKNQWPLAKNRALSTHTVRNSHTVAEAREDVRRIWNQVIQPRL